jgi:hypothetical protein
MKLIKEAKRLQQLAGINEINVNKPLYGSNKLFIYGLHGGEGVYFQTERGILILKSILDDYNAEYGHSTSNAYSNLNIHSDDDTTWYTNHPLYKKYEEEGYKLYQKLLKISPGVINDSGDPAYIGPSLWNHDISDEEYERILKTIEDNFEESNSEEADSILLSLISD